MQEIVAMTRCVCAGKVAQQQNIFLGIVGFFLFDTPMCLTLKYHNLCEEELDNLVL